MQKSNPAQLECSDSKSVVLWNPAAFQNNVRCSSVKKRSTILFLVCYCSYMVIYIARVNLTIAAPELRRAMILTTAQIGTMGGVFSVVYAIGRLLSGYLGDRIAPWKLLCTGLLLTGIGNALIGLFPPFFCMLLLWALNALAQSMLWSPILRLLASQYGQDAARQKSANMGTAIASGNVAGIILTGVLVSRVGLAWGFAVPGALAILFCTLAYHTVHRLDTQPSTSVPAPKTGTGFLVHKSVRRMLLPAMLHGVIKDNVSLWMSVYLVDRFGLHLEESSWYVLLIPVAGLLGRILYTALYRMCREQESMVSMTGAALCLLASAILAAKPSSAWMAVLCLGGVYAAASLINTTILSVFPMRFAAEGTVSSISGCMDFATYLGAGIGSFLFSALVNAAGYSAMFTVWSTASILCCLCFFIEYKNINKICR